MTDLFPPSIADQIATVEREIRMREAVYPRRVAGGHMSQEAADREIARMRAALETLKSLSRLGRAVVFARYYDGDDGWDKLKEAIGALEDRVGRPATEGESCCRRMCRWRNSSGSY